MSDCPCSGWPSRQMRPGPRPEPPEPRWYLALPLPAQRAIDAAARWVTNRLR
jgi:hypothetical protein